MELISFQNDTASPDATMYLTASPTKFNLSNEVPYMHQFYEWLTGNLYLVSSGFLADSYITGSYLSYNVNSNTLTLSFTAGSTHINPA